MADGVVAALAELREEVRQQSALIDSLQQHSVVGGRPVFGGGQGHKAEDKAREYAARHDGKAMGPFMLSQHDGVAVLVEFLGTILLVFVGVGSATAAQLGTGAEGTLLTALGFGAGYAALAYAFAPLSGAHFNPAVTAALAIAGAVRPVAALLYIVAQLVGAMVGTLIIVGYVPDRCVTAAGRETCIDAEDRLETLISRRAANVSAGQAALAEIAGTCLLCLTMLRVAADPGGGRHAGAAAPLAVGLAVLALHGALVPLTGCSLNPARSFGVSAVVNKWDDHWIFWVGPLAGAVIASVFYLAAFRTGATAAGAAPAASAPGYAEAAAVVSPPHSAAAGGGAPRAAHELQPLAGPGADAMAQGPNGRARWGDQWLPVRVAQRCDDGTSLVVWQNGEHSRLDSADVVCSVAAPTQP